MKPSMIRIELDEGLGKSHVYINDVEVPCRSISIHQDISHPLVAEVEVLVDRVTGEFQTFSLTPIIK